MFPLRIWHATMKRRQRKWKKIISFCLFVVVQWQSIGCSQLYGWEWANNKKKLKNFSLENRNTFSEVFARLFCFGIFFPSNFSLCVCVSVKRQRFIYILIVFGETSEWRKSSILYSFVSHLWDFRFFFIYSSWLAFYSTCFLVVFQSFDLFVALGEENEKEKLQNLNVRI